MCAPVESSQQCLPRGTPPHVFVITASGFGADSSAKIGSEIPFFSGAYFLSASIIAKLKQHVTKQLDWTSTNCPTD